MRSSRVFVSYVLCRNPCRKRSGRVAGRLSIVFGVRDELKVK